MDESLEKLVDELVADASYARGRPHARRTRPAEATEILEDLYQAHVEAARHLPVVAEKMGHTIACKRGCDACCRELIAVSHAEAHAVAAWLKQPAQSGLKQRLVARARAWVKEAGAAPAEALAKMRAGDAEGYRALRREHALRRIMCPANEAGACAVYPVRPMICRMPYVVDTAAHCPPSEPPGPPAQLITSEPYERFRQMASQLVSGVENTLGHDPRARAPLPSALLEALGLAP